MAQHKQLTQSSLTPLQANAEDIHSIGIIDWIYSLF
jgi:hypothetical protein